MSEVVDPASEIFLSYAGEDVGRVRPLVQALETLQWSVFWDREILPGATWRETIGSALDEARVVIVVWSSHSVDSRWVLEEAEQAANRGILLPVMLDDVELPLGFRSVQAARLTEWNGGIDESPFDTVVQRVADLIDKGPGTLVSPSPRKRVFKVALAGVLTTATVGLVSWGVWTQRPIPAVEYRRVFYDSFDGPLEASGVWLSGKRDGAAWEGSAQDGVHSLCNVDEDDNPSFTNRLAYDHDGEAVDQGDARISARVAIRPPFTQYSAAGLLFRAAVDRPDYYALVVTPGGTISVYRRTSEALRVVWSAQVPGVTDGEMVELAVEGLGATISFFVGAERVYELEDQDLGEGDPGIFGYSLGCFDFDEVAVFHPTSSQ